MQEADVILYIAVLGKDEAEDSKGPQKVKYHLATCHFEPVFYHDNSPFSASMVHRLASNPFLRSARLQFTSSQSQRYFSSTIQKADSPAQPTNHERTTHFGFQTVAESEKEARGMFHTPSDYIILTSSQLPVSSAT
jgi:hypothetical protein